jgi:hypothetical protein
MKNWQKYSLFGLLGFGLGAAVFGIAIKEPVLEVSGKIGVNADVRSTSMFVANFQQRDMSVIERRIYPDRLRMVTVDLHFETQYARPTPLTQCEVFNDTKLVDGNDQSVSGIKIVTQSGKKAPKDPEKNQICIYKFAFAVPEDKVLTDDWALVVNGSRFPKLNQHIELEAQVAR